MPIYEYQCRQCGYRLDALQKMSDAPLEDCPQCAQSSLRKLVSAPHFRLKGSGWYETDFKNSGREKEDAGAKAGDSGAGAGNGKETDGKDGKTTPESGGGESSAKGAKGAKAEAGADSG